MAVGASVSFTRCHHYFGSRRAWAWSVKGPQHAAGLQEETTPHCFGVLWLQQPLAYDPLEVPG